MQFASPLPIWLAVLLAAAIAAVAFLSYHRPLVPLTVRQRGSLIGLRACSLAVLLILLCRPTVLLPARRGDVLIPVLVDTSLSMRVPDAGGGNPSPRIAEAVRVLEDELLPALSRRFTPELFEVGETAPAMPADMLPTLKADRRRSELHAALNAVRERYRGRRISGIVLLSDGGDTSEGTPAVNEGGPPVFAVGIGRATGLRDREVLGVSAGDPRIDQTSVDLRVTAVSHDYGREPFELQVRANGRPVESRRMTPAAEGSPVDATFTVVPDPLTATVFTVEAGAGQDESIVENNARTIIVSPAGRKRRILALEGAPGFEHSFMIRALTQDPGLEIDSVVRKGKNDAGRDTFLVQAEGGRAPTLAQGLPLRKEELFAYDALVLANIEGEFFTRAQLGMIAEFVGERGGGLLVLGGRSFSQRGLIGTPLEEVLPVELNDRRGGLGRTAAGVDSTVPHHVLVLTADGERHPVMRIASTLEETRKRWAAMPSLAASATLGGPRPGASVLAVVTASAGTYPVVAVQRYGRGRSMVFGGEAAWRWKMMLPSTDRTSEFFWRQSARWLAGPSPDPVTVTVPGAPEPGDSVAILFEARDAAFAPVGDATIHATLTLPGGTSQALPVRRDTSSAGRWIGAAGLDHPGLYRVQVEARRGATALGTADRWFYVGGAEREFADPRLNEGVLRRIATASGGRYVPAAEASRIVSWLEEAVPQNAAPERRDLWHEPWTYAVVIALLTAEWVLRRRWGLR